MPDQPPHEFPLSFVPWFETSATHSTARLVDPASSEHLRQLMRQQGYELRTDPGALKAALELCEEKTDRAQLLEATTTFFRGRATMIPRKLDTLPTPWLKGLPGILRSQRKDHWTLLPYMISEMASTDGVLQIRFAQEASRRADGPITGYDQVRIAVNAALYPSLWRPLTRRHEHLIRPRRPSLGASPNLPLE
jgi:hypothetical protein